MKKTENAMSNLAYIKNLFAKDETFTFREFCCKNDPTIEFCIVFIEGMTDKTFIHDQIIKPVTEAELNDASDINQLLNVLSKEIISAANVHQNEKLEGIIQNLLSGSSALFVKEFNKAIIINTADWEKRSISEPESEKTVTGPREGFVEDINTNIMLLRRKLKTSKLKLRFREIGTETKTRVCICFIDNIADKKIIEEVNKRIKKIEIDGILDSEYLQELIKDTPLTPFKTTGFTERPDVVVGKLLEGRVAIICDGTPVAITIPFTFVEYFNVNEDYYSNFYYATLNRVIRWIGFFLASSVPAIYVALITFHQEMLPTQLLLSISASRQNVPFPTLVEAILMLFVFELLRETSVRIPTVIGQTISIVGALVIGQAAVEAKLVSAPMIIVAAITGITSFVTPKMQGELILTRLVFLFAASFVGLYGYLFGVIGMFIHLASLRSFGIPYMLNIGTLRPADAKDVMLRVPWQKMRSRPKLVAQHNKNRITNDKETGDKVE
ncbi:MAG: spore gernimation protein KA [Clostridiales bacterium GWB2_37_7]|nr:MAG: spore gernimation protein KA [Clostridiales bacterium GWB2_37_7]